MQRMRDVKYALAGTPDQVKREIENLHKMHEGDGELEWFGWFFDQGMMSWTSRNASWRCSPSTSSRRSRTNYRLTISGQLDAAAPGAFGCPAPQSGAFSIAEGQRCLAGPVRVSTRTVTISASWYCWWRIAEAK